MHETLLRNIKARKEERPIGQKGGVKHLTDEEENQLIAEIVSASDQNNSLSNRDIIAKVFFFIFMFSSFFTF